MASPIRVVTGADYQALVAGGALPLDLRRPSDFVEGHVQGSRSLPYERFLLRQELAVLGPRTPLLLIATDPGDIRQAMYETAAAGSLVAGVLTGHTRMWASRGLDVLAWNRLTPENWLLHAGQPPLWDIREAHEDPWPAWPPGERHPLTDLMADPPAMDPAVPICLLGPFRRQVAAAVILYNQGARRLFYGTVATPRVVANWGKAAVHVPTNLPVAESNQ
jgi:rhodanese-related sulfurtransferase